MGIRSFNFLLLSVVYGLTFLLVSWRLWKNLRAGGDLYQQGSWVINFGDGIVRRGAAGEMLLAIANATGTSLMTVLGVVQFGALALVMTMLLLFAIRTGLTSRVTLLLLSPTLVLFWFNDSYAPLRMEVLGYLAFAPLFLRSRSEVSSGQILLSLAIFAVAVACFEVNVVFAVPLALVLYILCGPSRATVPMAASGIIAVSGAVFALTFLSVPTTSGMCARAVASGASPVICEGLMPWMEKTLSAVLTDGLHEFLAWGGLERSLSAVATMVVLIVCLVALVAQDLRKPNVLLFLSLCILAFVPFYALGSDWGRWVSMQIFSCIFVIMALERTVYPEMLRSPLSWRIYGSVISVHLTLGMFHMVPFALPGFVFTVLTAMRNALT